MHSLFEEHHLFFGHVVRTLTQSHQGVNVVVPDFLIPMPLLILSEAVGLTNEELLLHVLLYLNLEILIFIIVLSLTVLVLVSLSF